MSISITRYVNITSGVGGVTNVVQRNLVARIFTGNTLLPPQTFVSFSNAAAVGTFFGTSSEEYLRALFYFSFISKNITSPQTIQFARWTQTAVAPSVQSIANNGSLLANWTSISNGSLGITITPAASSPIVATFTGIDFTAVPPVDLSGVAAIIQTAIRTNVDPNFATATVTYDATHGFVFTGGVTGAATISIQAGITGTNLTSQGLLGWLPAATFDTLGNYTLGAITSSGSAAETVTQALTASANISNNFGSFLFLNNLSLSLANAILAAQWNITQNNMFMFCALVTRTNYSQWVSPSSGLGTYPGTALTLSGASFALTGTITSGSNVISNLSSTSSLALGMPVSGTGIPTGATIIAISSGNVLISANATASATESITFTLNQYPEQIPAMILAATNYEQANSVQNYMFQGPFTGLIPLVMSDVDANTFDAVSVNYYGSTQQAGNVINFYQTGVLQGTNTSPNDMTSYTNEMWLKDAITVAIMGLFTALPQIPANQNGRSLLLTGIQTPINQAIVNGTISVNKPLSQTQKDFIYTVTNDPNAWYQVQNSGYWLDAQIVQSGAIYSANYTLVYSKDDVIRLVTGQDILI